MKKISSLTVFEHFLNLGSKKLFRLGQMDYLKEKSAPTRCVTTAVYLQQLYEDCMMKNKEIIFLLGKVIILHRE